MNGKPPTVNGSNRTFPATKAQQYRATRPAYSPQIKPARRRRRRNVCCCCCWLIIILIGLALLAVIAGGILWVLYRPQRPSFDVNYLRFASFNLTSPKDFSSSSPQLNARLNLTVLARNPNRELVFFYDPMSISVSCHGADLAHGSFPALVQGTKDQRKLKAVVSSNGTQEIDSNPAALMRSDLKKKKKNSELPLEIKIDTKIRVKLGGLKSKKVGIRVSCDGMRAAVPSGKVNPEPTSEGKCRVKLRIKIWKWQF